MNTNRWRRMWSAGALAVAGLTVSLVAGGAEGQTQAVTPDPVPPSLLSDMAGIDIVSLRAEQLLAHRKDDAENLLKSLDVRASEVRGLLEELRAAVEIKKRETDITKTEKDLANKQKRKADKEELERTQKRQEQERKLLERQRDAAEQKLRFYDAQQNLMRAQMTAFDREVEINRRIEALDEVDASDPAASQTVVSLKKQIRDLERVTLTAMEKVADAEQKASERRRGFIRAQLEVVKARNELIALGG